MGQYDSDLHWKDSLRRGLGSGKFPLVPASSREPRLGDPVPTPGNPRNLAVIRAVYRQNLLKEALEPF